MTDTVRNNTGLNRFELDTEAGIAFASYRLSPGKITIFHTEVPAALRGRGIGSTLARGALGIVRQQERKLVARCCFIRTFLKENPEFNDLLS